MLKYSLGVLVPMKVPERQMNMTEPFDLINLVVISNHEPEGNMNFKSSLRKPDPNRSWHELFGLAAALTSDNGYPTIAASNS